MAGWLAKPFWNATSGSFQKCICMEIDVDNNDDERKEYGTRKQETANEATSLSRCLYL
jgi:hypothetical protein